MSEPSATVDFERMGRARFARTVGAMRHRGTDLLLLSRYPNAHYVSGARRVQVAGSGGFVPWAVVCPGDPAPVVYTPDLDGVPEWMAGGGRPLVWNPSKLIADLKTITAPRRQRIAVDLVSPRFFKMLEEAFPGAEWQDGEELLAGVKAIKDEDEIKCLERALGIAEATLGHVISRLRPGVRESELAAAYLGSAIGEGATALAHEGSFRVRTGARPGRLSADRLIRDGDLVSLETAVSWGGYQGEAARTWFAAAHRRPSAPLRALFRRWREEMDQQTEACRPGASPGSFSFCGIGTGVEPPRLPLREGMVLVLKSEVSDPEIGRVSGSETIVIEKKGARRLSRLPDGPLGDAA